MNLVFAPSQIESWPIERLRPYARNAKMHGDDQVAKIAASMAKFGWTVPCMVADDGELIAGHGRVLAATMLGLGVLAVDKVQPPHGRTLTEHVDEVTDLLERTEPSAIMDWDLHLADAGYDSLHDYTGWRWIVSSPEFHAVADGFPRIAAPVPLGVAGVTYALALSACAPFRTDWEQVRAGLAEEDEG